MNEAILLVGNIGSGKSTLAREYAKKNYYIVDQDDIRYMLGGGKYIFDLKTEPIIKDMSSLLIKGLCEAKIDFVVDGALVNKDIRKRVVDIIKQYSEYNIVAHVLPVIDKRESVDRRMKHDSRGYERSLWEEVYDKFESKRDEISISEGFTKIIYDKEMSTGLPCVVQPFIITEEMKERQKELANFLHELEESKKRTEQWMKEHPIYFKSGGVRFDCDIKDLTGGTRYA